MAGVVYYGIFASGERQPWADGPPKETVAEKLISPASNPDFASLSGDPQQERFLSKSVTYGAICKDEDDGDTPDWFLQSM